MSVEFVSSEVATGIPWKKLFINFKSLKKDDLRF